MVNVAFDCERMKNRYTGLYEYCKLLGQSLVNARPSGSSLLYYVPSDYVGFWKDEVGYLRYRPFQKLCFPKLRTVDVWHITHQGSQYVPRSRKIKKVLTIHDLNFLYEKKVDAKIKKYIRLCQKSVDQSDHIVTISEYAKQDILTYLNVGAKPVTVIHNGCMVRLYPEYDSPSYQPKKPFLFSLGIVLPKKNFHVLPALLAGNSYELLIAGNIVSDYNKKIVEEAKKFGVEDRVKILGSISDEDKYWYLKNCSAFLFPSLAEGFGIPAIEAMHFGKPVLLSTKTSLPEIGGPYAYYFGSFDVDDMRHTFTESMKHYEETAPAQKIIDYAGRFDWNESAKKYWNVYESLISER